MSKQGIILLVWGLLLWGMLPLRAQQRDFSFRPSISLEKQFTKRTSASLFNQYSFNQNLSELGYVYFDLGAEHRLNANFTVGANYRLNFARTLDNIYQVRNSLYVEGIASKWLRRWNVQYRLRYMTQHYEFGFGEAYRPDKNWIRNRLMLRYKISGRYTAGFYCEHFFRLNHHSQMEALRLGPTLAITFDQHRRLELYYFVQQQFNRKQERTDFVLGLTYFFKI